MEPFLGRIETVKLFLGRIETMKLFLGGGEFKWELSILQVMLGNGIDKLEEGWMTSIVFNKGKTEILNGGIDLLTDTIKVALVGSGYLPDKDGDDYFDDVSAEVSGTGYTAGGKTLVNKSISQDDTNDRASFDGNDLTWTATTITVRGAVLYKDTGTESTSPLIAYIDFGEDLSKSGADFTLQWDSAGIFYVGE